MFFLIRSAICIGLVVAALPDTNHNPAASNDLSRFDSTAAQAVATAAENLCRRLPDRCTPLVVKAVSASLSSDAARAVTPMRPRFVARISSDTLTEADRRPLWTGSAATAID